MDARTALTDAWPLFGLRLRTERLVLRMPTDDDLPGLLAVAKAGLHPPETMPFGVAWSTLPSPAFERGFLQHYWRLRATWSADAWALNLMVELDGQPIGAQSIDAASFAVHRRVHTGSWLGLPFQGHGYGKEMRAAVLALAFDGLGARVAETEAFLDNAPSNGVSRALGYDPNGLGSLAPEGVSRETQRFRMTLDGWRSRERGRVDIDGLEGCRDMFGL
ncbi:MAG: GNAT family N-acetyltransferase [Chloroflexota bacterium]